MGFDHSIRNGRVPFHCADSQNCKPPVAGNVPQPVGKIPFTLVTQPRDPMWRYVVQYVGRKPQFLQIFQAI